MCRASSRCCSIYYTLIHPYTHTPIHSYTHTLCTIHYALCTHTHYTQVLLCTLYTHTLIHTIRTHTHYIHYTQVLLCTLYAPIYTIHTHYTHPYTLIHTIHTIRTHTHYTHYTGAAMHYTHYTHYALYTHIHYTHYTHYTHPYTLHTTHTTHYTHYTLHTLHRCCSVRRPFHTTPLTPSSTLLLSSQVLLCTQTFLHHTSHPFLHPPPLLTGAALYADLFTSHFSPLPPPSSSPHRCCSVRRPFRTSCSAGSPLANGSFPNGTAILGMMEAWRTALLDAWRTGRRAPPWRNQWREGGERKRSGMGKAVRFI
jgi:hypothetical protein